MGTFLEIPKIVPHVEPLTGLTPWEACMRLADQRYLLFLDSAQACELGRYAFVSADPACTLTSQRGKMAEDGQAILATDPLARIQKRLSAFPMETLEELPPFQGGVAGLFGYDLCHHFERLPRARHDDFCIPDLAVGIYDWTLAFDLPGNRAWLISTGYPEADPTRRKLRARQRADLVKRRLDRPPPSPALSEYGRVRISTPQYPVDSLPGISSDFDHASYLGGIGKAIEYINAGDCFQVNIAQRLLTVARDSPLDLYGKLRERNPAPFGSYFDIGSHAILSASPERFMCVRHGEVETRPIKGTRPRGRTHDEDQRLADELCTSQKDRAENVMIVDLLRNDLGRVCEYGTVRVAALCRLESYPFVHHLVSEVRGKLRPELGPTDLLRASFPGGSVTGAPKIRAMEVIAELEPVARGPYCGCLGYLGFNGAMDTNLLIRTLVQSGGWLHFSVGGGIVADSLPDKEYDETWHKAEGLLRALGD